jgi:hypothetical protein
MLAVCWACYCNTQCVLALQPNILDAVLQAVAVLCTAIVIARRAGASPLVTRIAL